MRFAREAIGLATVLAITIGIKAWVLGRPEPRDVTPYLSDMATALQGQGFATRPYKANSVLGARGPCMLRARPFSPYGFDRADIEAKGASIGPTRYAYRGQWLDDPPKLRPLTVFYVQRELARLGFVMPAPIVLAVSVSPRCSALPSSWTDLAVTLR